MTGFITLLIAVGLLGVFSFVVIRVVLTADSPPLLADPQPTAPPTPTEGKYPPQFRGPYDPNSRLLAVLAVVAPLLTTIVGFYFGHRAGESGKEAVEAKANEQIMEISQKVGDAKPDLLEELRNAGLLKLRR